MLRLPQDAFVGDRAHGVPDLTTLEGSVEQYAELRARGCAANDFAERARACWGLVARGNASLAWCEESIRSGDADRREDAAGVLAWVGCPEALATKLRRELRRLPDGPARDLLVEILRSPPRDTKSSSSELEGVPLRGEGEPFTSILYFVEAAYEALLAEHAEWRRELKIGVAETRLEGPLVSLLAFLEPVSMPSTKYLFVETPSPWTAVISQASDLNWVDYFARRMRTRVVKTVFAPHVARAGEVRQYGSTGFAITDGVEGGSPLRCVRSLQASHQGSGWRWVETGHAQPFEETDAYANKRVRERLDLARLNRYCLALGIRRADDEFYGPRATLLVQDTSTWPRQPTPGPTSRQWRAEHG
jgi:hypothetical protein